MALRIDSGAEPIPGYRLVEPIGSGGFGEVWKAIAPGGLAKAIKVIHGDLRSADPDGARHAEQELRALKRLTNIRHPYLLSIERFDVIEGRLLIVSELADCNLWDRMRECRAQGAMGIPRDELLRYMEEAAEVLDVMNTQHQLQHLDIKPQNIFLMYNHAKVADFGLVKDLEGMKAAITGGVTPVYAAPETFNQEVTRYCDQYSLAIVYQELLTGVRPFNGNTAQKLLMQHIREAPDVSPLPEGDRPAVMRALSKKPEDRFPTCLDFIRALREARSSISGSAGNIQRPLPAASLSKLTGAGSSRSQIILPPAPSPVKQASPPPPIAGWTPPKSPSHSGVETPKGDRGQSHHGTTPPSQQMGSLHGSTVQSLSTHGETYGTSYSFSTSDVSLPQRTAPQEITGEGTLFPTVIVALGQSGLQALLDWRRRIRNRFGSPDRLACIRLIFIDTDSETIQTAVTGNKGECLSADSVLAMKLNRPTHYLKPRRAGRTLIEGWFDPQALYRIPRTPSTMGLRSFGRLAFLDHYRAFATKLTEALEAVTLPESLERTDRLTQLGIRSNRPRIYVVSGLAGGTGGGMFLDVAYAARLKLRQFGYTDPEVIGLLSTPPSDKQSAKSGALANTYASLKELHHFSLPETVFTANFDEREGMYHDANPPFSRVMMVLPNPSQTGSTPEQTRQECARKTSDLLIQEILSPMGRAADEARGPRGFDGHTPPEFNVSACGRAGFLWPREAVLNTAARTLSATMLHRWLSSDPNVIGEYVHSWLEKRWVVQGLNAETLIASLRNVANQITKRNPDELFAEEAKQFAPKGWFAREPEPEKLWQTVNRLQAIVGHPDDRAMQRAIGSIEPIIEQAAAKLSADFTSKCLKLSSSLLEHPDYRIIGAECVVQQCMARIDEIAYQMEAEYVKHGNAAIDAYETLLRYLNAEKGQKRPSHAEVAEAVRNYPSQRLTALIAREVCRIYIAAKQKLTDQVSDLKFCRQRLEEVLHEFEKPRQELRIRPEFILLPPGVESFDRAVQVLQDSISRDDVRNFDKGLQARIEQEFNALFSVCISAPNLVSTLQVTIEEEARNFLRPRLGPSQLSPMYFTRFPDANSAAQAVYWLYDQADPGVQVRNFDMGEVTVTAIPDGTEGEPLLRLAEDIMPTPPSAIAPSADEFVIYREYTRVPLAALSQMGPFAEDVYHQALDNPQNNPHSRMDITAWHDVEPVR